MDKLILFKFEGANIRVIDRMGNPWFILADVCRVLKLENPTEVAKRLDEDEKTHVAAQDMGLSLTEPLQMVRIISESGLYTIVLRSRDAVKPGTINHRFRKWVTGEVLPALRATGSYGAMKPEDVVGRATVSERLRMVSLAFEMRGAAAGVQMWFKVDLPGVPLLLANEPSPQGDLFEGGPA